MWNSRVPLVEERDHSETFIQKVDAPDKFIEEARAAQDELGMSRESIAAERELAAVANLQADDCVNLRGELRTCQKSLDAERERSQGVGQESQSHSRSFGCRARAIGLLYTESR